MKLVLTTAPADRADAIARMLVDERLAACVARIPGVRSVYRWKGAIEESDEVQLVAKTSDEAAPRAAARIAEVHPYDVPEILVLDVDSSHAAYAAWVAAETRR
ncbi:MAG: Divalent-cation tolerance protein CutA [Planctomycetes bacterium]|nr:Divalent-cation tolerance protein CutA [Planctomycetota bacterium]